jgi:hypothetical protein
MSFTNYQPVQPKKNSGCGAILIVALVIAIVFSAVRYFIDKSNYTRGHQAYLQVDCQNATVPLSSVVDAFRLIDIGDYEFLADRELLECNLFQDGADKQATGDPSGAILAYSDFVVNYGESPLSAEAFGRVESLFTQTNVDTLATEGLCDQLESLEQGNFIPLRSSLLPNLLYECGQTYEKTTNYSDAIHLYERFYNEYPAHLLAPDVEDALARAIVAEARASGAGTIPAPQRSGDTSSGSTVVVIQNDSPERLRIIFSGPDSRIEELEACSSCQTYSLVGPLYCPEQGPIGRYTLPPGPYDVVVQSISDKGVTPWTGDWDLISGDEYYNCFFITETSYP